jgi:hypothetical protein
MDNKDFNTDGEFDLGKFNDGFDKSKQIKQNIDKEQNEYRLKMMNSDISSKSLYKSNVSEIIIGLKDAWFYLLDDLLQQKFTSDTLFKDNRLFYIGLTFVIIALILYIHAYFSSNVKTDKCNNASKTIIEKHYYHPFDNINNANNVHNMSNISNVPVIPTIPINPAISSAPNVTNMPTTLDVSNLANISNT